MVLCTLIRRCQLFEDARQHRGNGWYHSPWVKGSTPVDVVALAEWKPAVCAMLVSVGCQSALSEQWSVQHAQLATGWGNQRSSASKAPARRSPLVCCCHRGPGAPCPEWFKAEQVGAPGISALLRQAEICPPGAAGAGSRRRRVAMLSSGSPPGGQGSVARSQSVTSSQNGAASAEGLPATRQTSCQYLPVENGRSTGRWVGCRGPVRVPLPWHQAWLNRGHAGVLAAVCASS